MKTSRLLLLGLGYILVAVTAAYIIYRMGWNSGGDDSRGGGDNDGGGSGGGGGNRNQQVFRSQAASTKPTGGYIPGRVGSKVQYN